jgi:uncharacterized protein YndB with AHSA1/START domain
MSVPASLKRTWSTITEAGQLGSWWPDLQLDARPGGGFVESWINDDGQVTYTRGRVLVMQPPRLLRLSWADDGWPVDTTVEFELRPGADATTTVTVRHVGWQYMPDGARLAEQHQVGWRRHLENLRRQLATT